MGQTEVNVRLMWLTKLLIHLSNKMGHRKNIQMCQNRFHCSECKRGFAQEFAKNNHQRLHRERIAAQKKNPERYGIKTNGK